MSEESKDFGEEEYVLTPFGMLIKEIITEQVDAEKWVQSLDKYLETNSSYNKYEIALTITTISKIPNPNKLSAKLVENSPRINEFLSAENDSIRQEGLPQDRFLLRAKFDQNKKIASRNKIITNIFDDIILILAHIHSSIDISKRYVKKTKSEIYTKLSLAEVRFDENIKTKIKSTEKDYIAILGIFAAILLAFVANITFSTSVLQNLHQSSFYRIAFAIILIAFFIVNILRFLFRFIENIVYKNISDLDKTRTKWYHGVFYFNIIFVILFALVGGSWYHGAIEKRNQKQIFQQSDILETLGKPKLSTIKELKVSTDGSIKRIKE